VPFGLCAISGPAHEWDHDLPGGRNVTATIAASSPGHTLTGMNTSAMEGLRHLRCDRTVKRGRSRRTMPARKMTGKMGLLTKAAGRSSTIRSL
jgi:hypothetical protein